MNYGKKYKIQKRNDSKILILVQEVLITGITKKKKNFATFQFPTHETCMSIKK